MPEEELNNLPEEPDIPKLPRKRVYRRKKKEEDINSMEFGMSKESPQEDFYNRIRQILGVELDDNTLMEIMENGGEYLEGHWDVMGKIVLPYVYGGMVIEGPQSTIKNAFIIGFFLGLVKEKHKNRVLDWNFGKTFLNDLKL